MTTAPDLASSDMPGPGERGQQHGYFLSLGAGPHQVPLIEAARRLGYPVVAVDRNLRAPGFAGATIQLQCSILRPRRIIHMLGEHLQAVPIAGVGCRSFGRAAMTAAVLAQVYRTPGHGLRALRRFQNKRRCKAMLAGHGVEVPRSFGYGTHAERDDLRAAAPPLIVRPASGHGKLGIHLLRNAHDIKRFLQIHLRDTGRLLVEPLVSGREITVLGMVQQGRFAPVCLTDKHVSPTPPLFVELGHDFPDTATENERVYILRAMQKIVDASGLGTGPLVAEFLIPARRASGEPPAYLVECAPEIGGEYLADLLLPATQSAATATDYFEDLVRLYTGGEFPTGAYQATPERCGLIRFIPQREGTLAAIELPDSLRKHPDLLFARLLKEPGARTTLAGGNQDRLAVFALGGPLKRKRQLHADAAEFVQAIEATVSYAA